MLELTWIPLVGAAAGAGVSAFLTWRRNARAKAAQAALEVELKRSVEAATKLHEDLRRLHEEAEAVSAKTDSAREKDLAVQLARIASQLEAKSSQLSPLEITGEVDH
ncbi:hypothetical protein [Mycobacterium sp. E2733]|uniref:hypothetical protein n=1 Tax=Mycobacterium sp. E2733 TaxID=1834138 RepID=UPI000A40F055|nr:hypothetical protein [Mycobacterium sp. E2733]